MFPLDQFNGANIWLPNTLTVQHPIRTAKDASNYVARLGQVATAHGRGGRRRHGSAPAKDLIPPRFILNLTIDQMRRFVATPPAQNPFVTSLDERAAAIKGARAGGPRRRSSRRPSASSARASIPNGTEAIAYPGIACATVGRSRRPVAPRRRRSGVLRIS